MIKTYNSAERQAGTRLVGFNIIKSGKRFLAKRVRLRNDIFSRLRQRFFRQKAESNNLVKKSVRVDSDIFNTLFNVVRNDEEFFTEIINSAVVNEISTGKIDHELRSRKITGVTFSSLVRSILYKHLGVVQEIEHNMKPIEEVA